MATHAKSSYSMLPSELLLGSRLPQPVESTITIREWSRTQHRPKHWVSELAISRGGGGDIRNLTYWKGSVTTHRRNALTSQHGCMSIVHDHVLEPWWGGGANEGLTTHKIWPSVRVDAAETWLDRIWLSKVKRNYEIMCIIPAVERLSWWAAYWWG